MQRIVLKKAKELVSEKLRRVQSKVSEFEEILKYWENDINWEVENPLNEKSK